MDSNLNDRADKVIFGLGYSFIAFMMMLISVMMFIALYQFVKIVSRTNNK